MKARAVHDFYKSSHPMGGFLMMSHSRYYHRPFHAREIAPRGQLAVHPHTLHLYVLCVGCWGAQTGSA